MIAPVEGRPRSGVWALGGCRTCSSFHSRSRTHVLVDWAVYSPVGVRIQTGPDPGSFLSMINVLFPTARLPASGRVKTTAEVKVIDRVHVVSHLRHNARSAD